MNFPPCPQPVNWPVYKLYSNQVLFLKNFGINQSCFNNLFINLFIKLFIKHVPH